MFPTDFYAVVLRVPEEYFIFKKLPFTMFPHLSQMSQPCLFCVTPSESEEAVWLCSVTSDSVSDCSSGDDRSLEPGPGRSGGARHGAVPHRAQRCPGALISHQSPDCVYTQGWLISH